MKRILFLLAPLLFISSLAFSQDTPYTYHLNGIIVDRNFEASHRDDLYNSLSIYSKVDALQASAVSSGYGIVVEDGYMLFDKKSNDKVVEFLSKPESTLQVSVEARISEDFEKGDNILRITTIENKGSEVVQ